MSLQSIVFKKKKFNNDKMRFWLETHDIHEYTIAEDNSFHIRVRLHQSDNKTYKYKPRRLDDGVTGIMEYARSFRKYMFAD
jgi:hypothetical protein